MKSKELPLDTLDQAYWKGFHDATQVTKAERTIPYSNGSDLYHAYLRGWESGSDEIDYILNQS